MEQMQEPHLSSRLSPLLLHQSYQEDQRDPHNDQHVRTDTEFGVCGYMTVCVSSAEGYGPTWYGVHDVCDE